MALGVKRRKPVPPPGALLCVGVGSLVLIENLQPDCSAPDLASDTAAGDKLIRFLMDPNVDFMVLFKRYWLNRGHKLWHPAAFETKCSLSTVRGELRGRWVSPGIPETTMQIRAMPARRRRRNPGSVGNPINLPLSVTYTEPGGRWSTSVTTLQNISDQCKQAGKCSLIKLQTPAVTGQLWLPWKSRQIVKLCPVSQEC